MDEFRKGVLRAVDNLTLAFRNAGQAYAFLGSGREMIHVSEDPGGPMVQFPDLADEGLSGTSEATSSTVKPAARLSPRLK